MPPNLRDLVGDIREAVERYSREQLVEVLIYVFKQYVVEGPAPLTSTPAPVHDDLEGMSFGEVIRSLQLRLDLPELELLEVQGDRVFVRVGGRAVAIEAQSSRSAPGPSATSIVPAPMAVPVPAPAVLPAAAAAPASSSRPRTLVEEVTLPNRRPSVENVPAPAAAAATRVSAPAPAAKPAEPAAPEPPRRGGLLEID